MKEWDEDAPLDWDDLLKMYIHDPAEQDRIRFVSRLSIGQLTDSWVGRLYPEGSAEERDLALKITQGYLRIISNVGLPYKASLLLVDRTVDQLVIWKLTKELPSPEEALSQAIKIIRGETDLTA